MRNLELQKGIIYGPVNSRRLGRSLGINLSPTDRKVCSFNCIYCHYGWTRELETNLEGRREDLPIPSAVERELRNVLENLDPPPDYITFSGNGEPSLHPDFPEIVDRVAAVRKEMGIEAKLAILSNSTGLDSEEVRKALARLDVRIMKLDAGNAETFRRINRPARQIDFNHIVENLSLLDGITLQSVFVAGAVTNADPPDVESWLEKVALVKPISLQVYSLENPPAMTGLCEVSPQVLRAIAEKVRRLGIDAHVF